MHDTRKFEAKWSWLRPRLSARTLCLLAVSFLSQGEGWAAITLADESSDASASSYLLHYESREAIARTPPRAPDDVPVYQSAPPVADSRRESILIATPGITFRSEEWSGVVENGDDVRIDFAPAIVGSTAGVQVSITPTVPGHVRAAVQLKGPPHVSRKQAEREDLAAERIVYGSFANSASAGIVKASSTPLPQPPASHRVVYTMGTKLVALPEMAETPRLLHHGAALPIGGDSPGARWVYVPEIHTLESQFDSVFIDQTPVSPSTALDERLAFEALVPAGQEVAMMRTTYVEPNLAYERAAPLPLRERFVVYRNIRPQDQPKTTQLKIDDAITSPVITIDVGLLGLSTSGFSPEHLTEISIDGETGLRTWSWGGRVAEEAYLYLGEPHSVPLPAARDLTFRHDVLPSTIPSFTSAQSLNYLRANYLGYPRISGSVGRVELAATVQPRLVTIGGFPLGTTAADVLLLDVTNEHAPVRITGMNTLVDCLGTIAIEFEAPAEECRFFAQRFADIGAHLPLLECPTLPVVPEHLQGIYVRDPSLAEALQPLMDHRGPGYIALDPEAAYVVYNGGMESPEAIRAAMADILAAAPSREAFPTVLLVGHATFDPRNHLGLKNAPQVPTFVDESIDTGFTIESCVDFPYGLLVGDDQLQDAQVGRLPVKSAAELTVMVDRILAHDALKETLTASPRPAVFVTDDDAEVLPDVEYWPAFWSGTGRGHESIVIDIASNGTAERAAIKAAMEAEPHGAAVVMYTGHGQDTFWADERVLRGEDLAGYNTAGKWSAVFTFTCLTGNYAVPNATARTLSEALLLASGGAIASVSPASVDYYEVEKAFAERILSQFALAPNARPQTIGELITRARVQFALDFPDNETSNRLFLLFGDPDSSLTLWGSSGISDSFLFY